MEDNAITHVNTFKSDDYVLIWANQKNESVTQLVYQTVSPR